jgi:hypothetical protein
MLSSHATALSSGTNLRGDTAPYSYSQLLIPRSTAPPSLPTLYSLTSSTADASVISATEVDSSADSS